MDRLLREGNPPTGQLASPKPQYKDVQTNSWEELKGEGGASYVKDKDALAKLEQVRELLVQLSRNDVVIGLLADRPPASEMRGRGYYAWDETDGHKLKYSDGTNWVVNQ